MNFFLNCCNDSELLKKLADEAAFYGNYVILKQIQHKYKDLPLETLLTQAINSESPESVTVVSKMMKKNVMTVTSDMIQAAQNRGVTKIMETLTGVPYDADHEKETVRLSILRQDDKSVAGKV